MRIRLLEPGLQAANNGQPVHTYDDTKGYVTREFRVLAASPDGEYSWGHVPDCLVPYPRIEEIPAGPIMVYVGDVGQGLYHVQLKHGSKIADLHAGMSVEAYICTVLRHYQEIYLQPDGSLVLLQTNGVRKCAVVAPVTYGGKTSYRLVTAYPLPRKPDYAKRGAVRLALKK